MKSKKAKVDKFAKRIHEIDFARGILILLVIMDHIFWNLGHYGGVWGVNWMHAFFYKFYWEGVPRQIIQPICLMLFCFISGVSCSFSKSNWKRAIETLVVWAVIALATNFLDWVKWFGDRTMRIDFNIIAVLGFSMLFYCFVQKRSWRALLAGALVAFLITWFFIPYLSNSLGSIFGFHELNHANHITQAPNFYFPLFWEPAGQADYVSLFPNIMFFFLGALMSYFLYKDKRQSLVPHKGEWERPVCFVGRNTLIIYLTHEFILVGIFYLLDLMIGG